MDYDTAKRIDRLGRDNPARTKRAIAAWLAVIAGLVLGLRWLIP